MAENFYEEARDLVNRCLEHRGRLEENEANFIDELAAKLERYKERSFISPKQMSWLRIIERKSVPDARQPSMF